MRTSYLVSVGNLGIVHDGTNKRTALGIFRLYRADSVNGSGRCAAECVTLFADDRIIAEHEPEETQRNWGFTQSDLVSALRDIRDDLRAMGPECEETDVRLRLFEGSWYVYHGPSDYDQDHRGHWGASIVARTDTIRSLRATAEDLTDQALESIAMSGDDGND